MESNLQNMTTERPLILQIFFNTATFYVYPPQYLILKVFSFFTLEWYMCQGESFSSYKLRQKSWGWLGQKISSQSPNLLRRRVDHSVIQLCTFNKYKFVK